MQSPTTLSIFSQDSKAFIALLNEYQKKRLEETVSYYKNLEALDMRMVSDMKVLMQNISKARDKALGKGHELTNEVPFYAAFSQELISEFHYSDTKSLESAQGALKHLSSTFMKIGQLGEDQAIKSQQALSLVIEDLEKKKNTVINVPVSTYF